MNIKILAVGKIKETYLKEGISLHLTRLKKYANVQIIEVNDEPAYENPSLAEIKLLKDKEGERLLKLIKPQEYVIALDLNQKQFKSPLFAEFLNKSMEKAGSSLTFLIGGSYGLSEAIKKRADTSFSLSEMTFLHQMTRLILLEQIYRAFKINHHEVYHK